ncbi:hypothetical protein [Novosphingobium sp. M1R2S20]|uniref:Uncharacterized protein n=1 Tax=Novosphingobium rhizovicinum TaxID=3228928 RepID=A0ABV3R729_9SPHN
MGQQNDMDDRFGVAESTIMTVMKEHRGLIRTGCYVPTRDEVATKASSWLENILVDWWWESPTALIPTWGQVNDVLTILRAREDADSPEIRRIIAEAPKAEDFI